MCPIPMKVGTSSAYVFQKNVNCVLKYPHYSRY
jgi:hypothetical protein